jgi:hypothetical protein
MKRYLIRQLHEDDKFIVSKLRRDTADKGFGTITDKVQLNWGPSDRMGTVYGAFEGDQIVSTLRADHIDTVELYESRIEASYEKLPLKLPVAVFCRGATLPEYEGKGFHGVLGMICIATAVHRGYEYWLATLKKNSPQMGFFVHLGCEFFELSQDWKGFLKDQSPPLVARAHLPTVGIPSIEYLKVRHKALLEQVEFEPSVSKLLKFS